MSDPLTPEERMWRDEATLLARMNNDNVLRGLVHVFDRLRAYDAMRAELEPLRRLRALVESEEEEAAAIEEATLADDTVIEAVCRTRARLLEEMKGGTP